MRQTCPHSTTSVDPQPYRRRHPEDTVLYQVLQQHLETFLAERQAEDRPLPSFVERELRRFLECGIFAHGFVRCRCPVCGRDRPVAFSCKGRAFCPSCGGRRMAERAAHWIDHVLPAVPIRQWVLSVPFRIRYLTAFDAGLVTQVLGAFLSTVFAWHRRRARRLGLSDAQTGSITAIQRSGSALNLNVHFHALVFDGVWHLDGQDSTPSFRELPPPTDGEVAQVATAVRRRVLRRLTRLDILSEDEFYGPDPLLMDEPLLAGCYGASVQGRIATGPRAGQRVERYGGLAGLPVAEVASPQCAQVDGFSLHANTAIAADQRDRLERVARYIARPPVANDRLELHSDGKIALRLKTEWSDGTTHVRFTPGELIEKLAALVPTPRANLIRYHGVLAPHAAFRPHIIPRPIVISPLATPEVEEDPTIDSSSREESSSDQSPESIPTRRIYYTWAQLLARVFLIDVLACPDCGSRMKVISVITDPEVIVPFLECVGLPPHPPPISPARAPPESFWS